MSVDKPRVDRHNSEGVDHVGRVTRVMLELLAAADGVLDLASARAAVEEVASREEVAAAVATTSKLVPDEDSWEADNRAAIAARYGVVRPFVRLWRPCCRCGPRRPGGSCCVRFIGCRSCCGAEPRRSYIRLDTHAAANARLVAYQAKIGITDLWGGECAPRTSKPDQ